MPDVQTVRSGVEAYIKSGAAAVYKLCIESGSCRHSDYKALAETYTAMGTPGKISELISEAETSELPRKASLIRQLRSIQHPVE